MKTFSRPWLFLFPAVLSLSLLATSCGEDGVIGQVTYSVVVVNNTADNLEIFESIDGGEFFSIGFVDANSSVKEKGFVIDADYDLEARNADGVVVAETSFLQSEDTDRTWEINN